MHSNNCDNFAYLEGLPLLLRLFSLMLLLLMLLLMTWHWPGSKLQRWRESREAADMMARQCHFFLKSAVVAFELLAWRFGLGFVAFAAAAVGS